MKTYVYVVWEETDNEMGTETVSYLYSICSTLELAKKQIVEAKKFAEETGQYYKYSITREELIIE